MHRRYTWVGLCVAVAIIALMVSTDVSAKNPPKKKSADDSLIARSYRVADLPIYTRDGKADFSLVMSHLTHSVTPKVWESRGGAATISPYVQNLSLIISAPEKTHKRIVKLLEQLREPETDH